MASTRVRIAFTEMFSSQATPQTRSLILVPRNECPTVGKLKEYIRKRFGIPKDRIFDLCNEGFSLPHWESCEVIRENDMLCVHSADVDDTTSSESNDCSSSARGKKRKVSQDVEKYTDHKEKTKKKKEKHRTEEGSDSKNVKKKKAKCSSDAKKSANLHENVQNTAGIPASSSEMSSSDFGRGSETDEVSLEKKRLKVRAKKHLKVPAEVGSGRSLVIKQTNDQSETKKKKMSKKKQQNGSSKMPHLSPVSQAELPTVTSRAGRAEKNVPPQLLPEKVNGIPNIISQSEVTNSQSDSQLEGKTQPPLQLEDKLKTSDQSEVETQTAGQSELATETKIQSEVKKKRRRRKRKGKSANSTPQGDSSEIATAVTTALFGTGDPPPHLIEVEGHQGGNPSCSNVTTATKKSDLRTVKTPPVINGNLESATLQKHQVHVKFDSDGNSDEDDGGSLVMDGKQPRNEQKELMNGAGQEDLAGDIPEGPGSNQEMAAHQEMATHQEAVLGTSTGAKEPKETSIKQPAKDNGMPAKDYGMYPPLNGPPRTGDVIAFKTLELSALYCPEVSEYKEGVVTHYDHSTQTAEVQLTYLYNPAPVREVVEDEEDENYGRFEMDLEDGWMTECQQQHELSMLSISFSSMIEPRLLP